MNYRNFESSNPSPELAAEFLAQGFTDHGTALAPRARKVRTEVFVTGSGELVKADSRTVAYCVRRVGR